MKNGGTALRSVWKRNGQCAANQHDCEFCPSTYAQHARIAHNPGTLCIADLTISSAGLDTGFADDCCPNDMYCFVSSNGESSCCELDSNCISESPCNSESYFCTHVATPSVLPSASTAAANATETGCCGRRCQKGLYLCPTDLGGNCCPYASECRPDGNCVSRGNTTTPASTTTAVTSSTRLASPTVLPCPGGSGCGNQTTVDSGSGGGALSTSTKTGIAVTVIAGAGVVIGMAAWLWVLKRRYNARAAAHRWAEETRVSEVAGNDVAAVELESPVGNDDGGGSGGVRGRMPMTEVFELEANEAGLNTIMEEGSHGAGSKARR